MSVSSCFFEVRPSWLPPGWEFASFRDLARPMVHWFVFTYPKDSISFIWPIDLREESISRSLQQMEEAFLAGWKRYETEGRWE